MPNIEIFKSLWQSTFNDNQAFVDFYFDRFFSEKRNIFIEENGKVISCLQAIPFPMKMENRIVPTCYLSGILTDKNFQKRGFMRQLMQKTHRQLYENGVWATTLIPAEKYLFEIYQKLGYEAIFKVDYQRFAPFAYKTLRPLREQKALFKQHNVEVKVVELQKNDRKIAFEYFNKKNLEREISLLATEDYFENICDLSELENKKIFVAKALCYCEQFPSFGGGRGRSQSLEQQAIPAFAGMTDKITGIALANEKGNILELFAENEDIRTLLLNKILQEFDLQEITFQFPAKKEDFGMLRIINVEKFLSNFAKNNFDKEFEFNVFDSEITENCGFYTLKNGFCTKQPPNNQPITTINQLAKIVFENKISAMTYMMNK